MKNSKIIVLAIVLMAGIFACKKSDDTNPSSNGTVTVTIGPANNIGETSITVPVVVSGNATIVQRGVCWDSIQTTPTISNHKKADSGTTSGSFSVLIDQLTPSTTYYVRGYVTTSSQTVYSPVRVYTTGSTQLTIDGINNITDTSASINASLIYSGTLPVGARGFCWGPTVNPTTNFSSFSTASGQGAGNINDTIFGLISGTKYHVRAYAVIGGTTIYSADSILTTTNFIYPRDVDGNFYTTVQIGTQVWMKQNLKTTKLRDGTSIPTNFTDAAWIALTTTAYSEVNNDVANTVPYGKLYNWYAVSDPAGLCPVGWHVPSDAEYITLTDFLGGDTIAGGKMKEVGLTHWISPNTDATNSSEFTGVGSGRRSSYDGKYSYVGYLGYLWTTSANPSSPGFFTARYLDNGGKGLGVYPWGKSAGIAVRCLRD